MADDPIDPQLLGQVARLAADKAAKSIPRMSAVAATVVEFRLPDDFGPGEAIVHIDGDPSEQTQAVKVATGTELFPGTRALVLYNPPSQAFVISAIGVPKVPAFRLTDNCSGGCE